MSLSASPSRDADAGTGQQQQVSQQKKAGLSVLIECHQSPWRRGPVLKEVIVSFTRRPSEEPGRSFQAHSSLQQQDGLEEREPERQGQGSSLRRTGVLDDTPGLSANSRMGWPETRRDRSTSLPWTTSYITPQQPRVICRRFAEGTINNKAILEQLEAPAPTSKPVAWTKEQECEDALGPELSEEEQWEDALDVEVSDEEEWQDAVDTELCQGTDDIGSSPVHHWVNSLGLQDNKSSHTGPKEDASCPTDEGTGASGTLERSQDKKYPSNECHEGKDGTAIVTPATQDKPSLVGKEAAAHPDQGQAFYNIHLSTLLNTLAKETQMSHRKVLSVLQKALIFTQGKGQQNRQQPTGCQEVVPEPVQSIKADSLDKEPPEEKDPGQQLVEAEPDLQLTMRQATEAGTPARSAFRSPSPTVIDALARERRTSIFKSAPRALRRAFNAMHRKGGQEQQQPIACAWDLPDTAQNIGTELLSKPTIMIQAIKQTEEQKYREHIRDATLAVRAAAAGAVSLVHAPQSPTADGPALLDTVQYTTDEILSRAMIVTLGSEEYTEQQRDLEQDTAEGMRVTAPAEGTKSPGHSVNSQTDDSSVFLDYNDYVQIEVVKKALLMVQKPFEYPDKKQDQELSAEGSTSAEKSAGRVQSLPAPTFINAPAQQRWLSPVWEAVGAPPLTSTANSNTGKKQQHPIADSKDLLDTAERIRKDIPDKTTIQIQGTIQQLVEHHNVEPSRDVSPAITPTAARTKSHVHETHSPTADAPVFLNASDYMHTEVIKKAVLVVQRLLEEPQEPWEQKQTGDEEIGAKATGAEAGRQTHVPQSPRANGQVLIDKAQHIPAPAEGTKCPGHSVNSQTNDGQVFLDYNDYVQTEVVKRALLMVQKPFEHPDKKQDQELSAEGSTSAEKSVGCVQSLPAPTLINTPARQRWLRPVRKALRALPLAPTAIPRTGEKKHPKADRKDLLDTAEYISKDIPDKATTEIQGSRPEIVEWYNMEPSRDVSPAVTPTAASPKSHEHSPTADPSMVFLDYNDCLRTEVVKKAALMVQKPFEYPE